MQFAGLTLIVLTMFALTPCELVGQTSTDEFDARFALASEHGVYVVVSKDRPALRKIERTRESQWNESWSVPFPDQAPKVVDSISGCTWGDDRFVGIIRSSDHHGAGQWSWWAYDREQKRWSFGMIDIAKTSQCLSVHHQFGDSIRAVFEVMKDGEFHYQTYTNDCITFGSLEVDTGTLE